MVEVRQAAGALQIKQILRPRRGGRRCFPGKCGVHDQDIDPALGGHGTAFESNRLGGHTDKRRRDLTCTGKLSLHRATHGGAQEQHGQRNAHTAQYMDYTVDSYVRSAGLAMPTGRLVVLRLSESRGLIGASRARCFGWSF